MIPFNKPPYTGTEDRYVIEAMRSAKLSGDGPFSRRCQQWFEEQLPCRKTLITPSCTHALEMCALLIDVQPGDEVIMPSYTFVSTANAFVLRGASIVFIDVRPDTLNMDESLIEAAITDKTRAIVPVHYAGVACEMDRIMDIAQRYGLYVIEDAAQGVMATYHGRALGTLGHLGAYSFHDTKNYTSGGEGGLLLINDERFVKRAEILREKGTNRSQFFRGMVDKYSWVDLGSSYLPSELQAAYLLAQMERAHAINDDRLATWQRYRQGLLPLQQAGKVTLPASPADRRHNAHMFAIRVADGQLRDELIAHLKRNDIHAVFHYVPLHTSVAGRQLGRFAGEDRHTTRESERLLRLPLWYGMTDEQTDEVCAVTKAFFGAA